MNIVVDHVTKTIHRAVVLQDISLNFESGKVYGLQGENGSGKTMLLRLMCGLIYATEGSVSVNDRRLGKELDFPESVGVMIESPAFIDEYTGQKNLELLAGLKQLISVSDIHNTLQAVGLDPNDKRTFKKYYPFHQGGLNHFFILISPEIKRGSQHLYLHLSHLYNKRGRFIRGHLKISLSLQTYPSFPGGKNNRIFHFTLRVQPDFRSVGQYKCKFSLTGNTQRIIQ